MSRTVVIVCMVSVNDRRIIAVCGGQYGIKEHQITVMAVVLVACIT